MKRAAAIIGPTPSFVRWTIRHDCKFRQLDETNQPYEAFRQLRNLREVSLGRIENRICHNFCIRSADDQKAETARGFPVDEVLVFFGTPDQIDIACHSCPANAAKYREGNAVKPFWAGCYGWMKSKTDSLDLVNEFDSIADETFASLPRANRNWYRVWQVQHWANSELAILSQIFRSLPDETVSQSDDLADLCDAIAICVAHQLVLETELLPAGSSDGNQWTLEAHCSVCKKESKESKGTCQECGMKGTWKPDTRRRVLGLRPYMILKDIIGWEQTEQLLKEFNNSR